MRRVLLRSLTVLCGIVLLGACDGPSSPAAVVGEPVCSDFELGATKTKMKGGLKHPVRLRVLDGDEQIASAVLSGLRTPSTPPTPFLLPDSNEEYTFEWAQCENERSPGPVDAPAKQKGATATQFECASAKVYETQKLKLEKGSGGTREVTFPPPPDGTCWEGNPVAPASSAAPSASAEPAPTAEPAPSTSASAAVEPAPSASASAAAAPGSSKPDAGAPNK